VLNKCDADSPSCRLNITKTLSALSKTGRPLTDQDMLRWANTTAQKSKSGVRPLRSFKDPSITTGLFFLDLLDAIRPGIVDPSLVIPVAETGPYEDRRQNGMSFCNRCCFFSDTWGISKTRYIDCEKDERSDLLGARGYCRRPPTSGEFTNVDAGSKSSDSLV